jgi:hypothetical protein
MKHLQHDGSSFGGSAPATPGFIALWQEWGAEGHRSKWRPSSFPAAESALRSHPCVALSSAQVLTEWIHQPSAVNACEANGEYPLNFVPHFRGSVQSRVPSALRCAATLVEYCRI